MPLYELDYSENYVHRFKVRVEAESKEAASLGVRTGTLNYKLIEQKSLSYNDVKVDWDSIEEIRE